MHKPIEPNPERKGPILELYCFLQILLGAKHNFVTQWHFIKLFTNLVTRIHHIFCVKNWNSSFKITFWWVECKWIRNTQIKFLSKYTWVSKLRGINFSKCFQFCPTSEVWCMVWDSWPLANFVHLCQGSTWENILFSLILSPDTLIRWLIG